MEIDFDMLVQNHVNYNIFSKKITLWGGGAMVKDLTPQCGGEEFKSPPCNLSCFGYLNDLIR